MSRPQAQSTLKGLDSLDSLGQEANGAVQLGRAGEMEAFGGSVISPAARRLGDFWSQATYGAPDPFLRSGPTLGQSGCLCS